MRRATLDDLEPIQAVYVAAWREGFRHMFTDAVFAQDDFDARRREECADAVFNGESDTFVAEAESQVVGFGVATRCERLGRLDDLWIHPASWGSGAAAAIISRIEDTVRSVGGRRLVAWVPEDSPSGRRFFDKVGWRPTGRIELLAVYAQERNRMFEYDRVLA